MATQRQIEANRRNAEKSTGPKTAEGKKSSALNAMKHGLYAKDFCLDIEDQESYRNYHYQLLLDWDPKSAAELILIEQVLRSHLLSRRYAAHMPDLYIAADHGGKPVVSTYPILMKMIYQADRTAQRALEQLAQIQKDRQKQEREKQETTAPAEEQEPLLNLPDPPDLNELAAAAGNIGFVPSPPASPRSLPTANPPEPSASTPRSSRSR